MSVGIPVKLLYEGIGHIITVESKSGQVHRGTLENAEDNMNCLLSGVTLTQRDGKVLSLEQVYIRGGSVRFMIFPDMLCHAPMFKLAHGKTRQRALGLAGMRRAMQMRGRGSFGGGFRARGRGGPPGGRGRGPPRGRGGPPGGA
eukprot:GHVT01018382.1.p1 GENE.GHVT01018382.1~~GHVT01018382.1.p1  ORF type:complete len:144 (+),score=10.74 GHVT01018382.1:241-672(+)